MQTQEDSKKENIDLNTPVQDNKTPVYKVIFPGMPILELEAEILNVVLCWW